MCKNPLLTKRFLKTLFQKFESLRVKYEISGCSSINLYFEDESRFGLLTVLPRMITAKGIKPVAPFQHRFDNLYLFGAFSPAPLPGHSCANVKHCFTVFMVKPGLCIGISLSGPLYNCSLYIMWRCQ